MNVLKNQLGNELQGVTVSDWKILHWLNTHNISKSLGRKERNFMLLLLTLLLMLLCLPLLIPEHKAAYHILM